jgi:hypothetical protein
MPDESRAVTIIQLHTLTGVAKGLTRTADSLFYDESPTEQLQTGELARAREDPRILKLRNTIFSAISTTLEYWSTDAAVSDVRYTFLTTRLSTERAVPLRLNFLGCERSSEIYNRVACRHNIDNVTRGSAS